MSQATSAGSGVPDFLTKLGLAPPVNEEDVKHAYMAKAKDAHPDAGGDTQQFILLQEAFERATQYARFRAGRTSWLSHWAERYAEQETLIARLRARGGQVEVEPADWLQPSIGEDFAQILEKLVTVRLTGPGVNDRVLDELRGHREVLSTLQTLDLSGSQITDQGLLKLDFLPALRRLNLADTNISVKGLTTTRQYPKFEWLGLRGTKVSWLEIVKLKLARPKLQIET